jgi:hypothetical protein
VSRAATWRRVGVAAAVSGTAHALVAVFGHIELPEAPPDRMPVAVRLAAPPVAAGQAPAAAAARRTAERAVGVAAAHHAASPVPLASSQAEEVAAAEVPAVETAQAPAPEPEQPVAAAETPKAEVIAEPAAPARSLPRKGRITYDLVYGRDRFPVGRTIQTWEVDGGRYQLASRSETTGIVDMIRSQYRNYSSRGALTREGLKPEAFKMARKRGGGRPNEEATAQFDWKQSTVTLGRAADLRQEKLPPNSQDLLSFIFQLVFDPPAPGRMTQVVTTGSRIEIYELDVRREEVIDTPLGMLRTLPIRQLPKGNAESIELWLAVEYRYLPVRVRIFDRGGEPQGEQIVSDIRLIEN